MPLPAARKAVPRAAVVLPLPGPVLMRMRPRRVVSGAEAESDMVLGYRFAGSRFEGGSDSNFSDQTVGDQRWFSRLVAGVVWMGGEDGEGAVNLLGEDGAGEFVG